MSSPETRRAPPAVPSISNRTKIESDEVGMGTGSIQTSTGQGMARNPSFRQTRPVRKSGGRTSSNFIDGDTDDEDTKALNAQIIADLKDQTQRTEQIAEKYRKQLEVQQRRLDDAAAEQTQAEERDFQRQTEIDRLRAEVRDSFRQRRELELAHESEKRLFIQAQERQEAKEADLQNVVQRLNETLRTRQGQEAMSSPLAATTATPSKFLDDDRIDDLLQTIQLKDEILDHLKLELADAHVRLAELEHEGSGRLQALEKEILDIKMLNARLVEENESFQMLLSEKTLKGDFSADVRALDDTSNLHSLADELALAGDDTDVPTDVVRRLETENKTLRESNKALTLYVDKIIGRLLQHDGFERIITDKDGAPPPTPLKQSTEKALPSTPPKLVSENQPSSGVASGLLQRAKSVVTRPGPRARPMSYVPPSNSANENPETAPRIPLNRGHRRSRSDQENEMAQPVNPGAGAAVVVQQMNRGSPLRTASGGPLSPRITPLGQNRMSYFPSSASTQPSTAARPSSRSGNSVDQGSSANSVTSDQSGDPESFDGVTSKAGNAASVHSTAGSNVGPSIPGAVMKQNQLRPLRLVQEKTALDEEQKRANRGSWMGWFRGNAADAAHPE